MNNINRRRYVLSTQSLTLICIFLFLIIFSILLYFNKNNLIQISKNKSLIFTIKDEKLEIEKSIFMGEKKIIDSACITINGNLVNKNNKKSKRI